MVPGARDAENVEAVVGEAKRRTGGRVLDLITSDDYPAYETAILHAYGQEVTTTPTGRPSRKRLAQHWLHGRASSGRLPGGESEGVKR